MRIRRDAIAGANAALVAAVAVAAGAIVCSAGGRPTASRLADVILVLIAVGATVWAATAAPWWATIVVTVPATIVAASWTTRVLGVLVVAGAFVLVARGGRDSAVGRAALAGAALNVLARLGGRWSFGVTAAAGIGLGAVLLVWGIVCQPRRRRRIAVVVVGAVAVVGIGAIIGLLVTALSARSHLERADDATTGAIDLLADGRFDEARAGFAVANAEFGVAADELSGGWGRPSTALPIAARYRALAVDLSAEATEVTGAIVAALDAVDLDALRPNGGQIDLAALERTRQPFHDLLAQLDGLVGALDRADDPWVVDAIRERFDDLRVEIDDQRARGRTLVDLVDAAPALLGADGPRTYFFAFTSPADARPLGGAMSNWAEITVTDGRIEMTDAGRASELEEADSAWRDVTSSPHFPDEAAAIAQLYPRRGGRRLDGVFAMDVDALVALLALTGPIEITGVDEALTVDNARDFLLRDQYLTDDDGADTAGAVAGIDALEELAARVVTRLLTEELPDPTGLADLFSPLVREQRIVAWADDADEEALFRSLRLDGSLPDRGGGDGLMVAQTNIDDSRIDVFLDGEVQYDVVLDPATGTYRGELTVHFVSSAPSSGLPAEWFGNRGGEPTGTIRSEVSLYVGGRITAATVGGAPVELAASAESGYHVARAAVEIRPGADATLVAEVSGSYDPTTGYALVVRNQAAVRPFATTVTIRSGAAGVPVTSTADVAGVVRIAG